MVRRGLTILGAVTLAAVLSIAAALVLRPDLPGAGRVWSWQSPGGASPPRDLAREAANKAMVVSFFTRALIDHDLGAADEYLKESYIQHNRAVGDGRAAFKAYFRALNERLANLGATSRGRIVQTMAEGDRVMITAETEIALPFGTAEFRAIDIFRVEDGEIAEHWDVIQGRDAMSTLVLMLGG